MTTSQEDELPNSITDRLTRLAQLEYDWDGYGGLPISPEAIDETGKVLSKALAIAGGNFLNPSISPTPDGGVGLEWRLPSGRELLMDVSPERKLGYLLVTPNPLGGEDEIEKDIDSLEELDKLLQVLSE